MKKVLLSMLSLILIFTVILGNIASAEKKYSGEELFKGFVFAQGEVGKMLPELFNQSMVKN
ncbi:hypothetical protein [Melghirimyces algeriensis]|uniref:Antimicrobial peptide, SdpC family n=1 Tax=Melghirimyces algeriensis TaxID=910412 RepID=A0A521DEN2_9BACL|nr:hypothetical protein [Melghirimyces algeriensis]SMO70113.1 antimicrobial peptide, SdpC family [Melghirimyces algeriensis]